MVETKDNTEATTEAPEAGKETVPLAVYLELKNELKEVKKSQKDMTPKEKIADTNDAIKSISEKFNVDENFLAAIEKMAEEKVKPIVEERENEKKIKQFNEQFDKIYNQEISKNPDFENVDKELVKTLSMTEQYKNTPIPEIIEKLAGTTGMKGRPSSEDDVRTASDIMESGVNFEKLSKKDLDTVLADPKAKAKYMNYLDSIS